MPRREMLVHIRPRRAHRASVPRISAAVDIKAHFGPLYYFLGGVRVHECRALGAYFWYFYGAQICCYSFYYIITSAYKQHREDIYELTQACVGLRCT